MPSLRRTLLAAAAWASLVTAQQEYCSSENTASNSVVTDIYNSNGACIKVCSGYAFAVVQYQNCWCSNYVPEDQQSVSNCNVGCPGYPSDKCGNEPAGLYGYIALPNLPSGTAGAGGVIASSSSSTPQQSFSQLPTSSSSTPSQQQTVSSQTIFITVTETPSSSSEVSSSTTTPSFSSVTSTSSSTSSSSTSSEMTSVQVVTVAGAPVTRTVTLAATAGAQGTGSNITETRDSSLSGGAIAGIVIGVLAGLALIFLALFLLWRSRKRDPNEAHNHQRSLGRNVSVLSRAGLITRGRRPSMAETNDETLGHGRSISGGILAVSVAAGSQSNRHSLLFSPGTASDGVHPESPLGSSHEGDLGSGSRSRRPSRPLVYDQRLNPSALFANHDNGSRVSMQDQQDYSRPLGVVNPDPETQRLSFDSRSG